MDKQQQQEEQQQPSAPSYDRHQLSALLRSSAQSLLYTDSELTKARTENAALQREVESLSATLAAFTREHTQQQILEDLLDEPVAATSTSTSSSSTTTTQTESAETPIPTKLSISTQTDDETRRRSPQQASFESRAEFERVCKELIDCRLRSFELEALLETQRKPRAKKGGGGK